MPDVTYRPLTPRERDELRAIVRGSSDWTSDVTGAGCLFAIGVAASTVLIRWLDLPRARWERTGFAVSAAIAMAVLVYMRRQLARVPRDRSPQKDLVRGEAEVTTYEVVDAIQVEEREDEGSQYYLKLVDGTVVFLAGQYLYDVEAQHRFPSTRVVVTRAPVSRVALDIDCPGTAVPPSARRPPFSDRELGSGAVPDDGEVVTVDFEDLRHGSADGED
jgi:hypothetical protein